jgi:hypothetical protein
MTVNFAYIDQAWGEPMIPKRKTKKQKSKYYDNIIDTYLGETQSGISIDDSYEVAPARNRSQNSTNPHDFIPLTDYYVGQEYQSDTVTDYTPPPLQQPGKRYQCPQNLPGGMDETTDYMNYADTYKPLYPQQSRRVTVEALPPSRAPPVLQEESGLVVNQEALLPPTYYQPPNYVPHYAPSQPSPQQFTQQQIIEVSLFLAGGAILIMILEQFVQMGALLRGGY